MFAWVPIPERFKEMGSLAFAKLLVEHADVAVAPGIGFGEHGDEFVRIAIVENEQRIRQAARNLRRFFDNADTHPPQRGEDGGARLSGGCHNLRASGWNEGSEGPR